MATNGNKLSTNPPKYLKATGRSMWTPLMKRLKKAWLNPWRMVTELTG